MAASRAAITALREFAGSDLELRDIPPTPRCKCNHDIMVPTINSFILSQKIPTQLIIYRGFRMPLFHFSELFVAHGKLF